MDNLHISAGTIARTLVLVLAIVNQILSACGKKEQDAKSMEQLHEELGIPVRVSQIESDTFVQQLMYNASLQGMQESTVQAMLGDVVTGIKAKVGDRATNGLP